MSSTYIDAQEAEKEKIKEKKDITLKLYFGVFFDSTESIGKGRELSRLYRNGYQKEDEKSYRISSTVEEPDCIYIEKDGVLHTDYKSVMELHANAGKVTTDVLSNILDVISGYAGSYNLQIEFDIYGFDSGIVASYALAHVIDPTHDKFNKENKHWIFDEISEAHISAIRNLSYKKEINHFTIAETKAAIRRRKEFTQSTEGTNPESNDGYVIKASVLKTSGMQTEISKQGFNKEDLEDFLDNTQAVLDGLGMVDVYGIGPIADALNVILSVARGKWGDAALSLLAIIPIIGNYATEAKIGRRITAATQIVKDADKGGDNVIDAADLFRKKNKGKAESIANMAAYKEYKATQVQDSMNLKTGTDGNTITNQVGGVSGGGGYYGWGKVPFTRRTRQSSDSEISIFSNEKKVEKISELYNVESLRNVGDSDHGQNRIIKIIERLLFNWRGNA